MRSSAQTRLGSDGAGIACGQHVRCAVVLGAVRCMALTGSRHRRYPRSSFLHVVAPGLWSKLWTPFERLAEILQ